MAKEKKKKGFTLFKKRVKEKDIVVFTRQLSTLVDAGLPLVQGLDILSKQSENPTFRDMVSYIKNDVESGSTLADSLKAYPKIFDDLFTSMVDAGETGGILDTVLQRLADYTEKIANLKKKIRGAMVYPAIVVSVAVIVVAIIMYFVIPRFAEMFLSANVPLPLPTRIVVNASNFIAGIGGLIVLGSIIAFIVFYIQVRRTTKGKFITDAMLLKIPVLGIVLNKAIIARFTRTLGTLIRSGVPILDGLDITSRTSGNKVVEKAVLNARADVSSGHTLEEPLSKVKFFPPMVTSMISIGEATGALDSMLEKIADFYDVEVDNAAENLATLIEPILIVFLGVVVGFIVISMYLPIFKMAGVVAG